MIAFLLGVVVLTIDQIIKSTVRNGSAWDLGLLEVRLFENDGLIFSIPAPFWISIILMITAALGIGGFLWTKRRQQAIHLPAALLFVGALSNVYDRIAHGAITDYLYLSDWWPIMNIADLAILAGILLLIRRRKHLDPGVRA